jgi:hypothetical protein
VSFILLVLNWWSCTFSIAYTRLARAGERGSGGMGTGGSCAAAVRGARPAVGMVVVELAFSALQIFIKLALDDGMDVRVLVAYRLMFATAFLCPLAFLVER